MFFFPLSQGTDSGNPQTGSRQAGLENANLRIFNLAAKTVGEKGCTETLSIITRMTKYQLPCQDVNVE